MELSCETRKNNMQCTKDTLKLKSQGWIFDKVQQKTTRSSDIGHSNESEQTRDIGVTYQLKYKWIKKDQELGARIVPAFRYYQTEVGI